MLELLFLFLFNFPLTLGKEDDELYKNKKQKDLKDQAEIAFNWNSFLIRVCFKAFFLNISFTKWQ